MSLDALSDRGPGSTAGHPGETGGDEDARALGEQIERLFRSEAPRLLRFLTRRTAEREEAADMLQESFLRLLRMAKARAVPDSPEAYLQRIASNLLRDRAKQRAARAEHLFEPLDEETTPDPGPDPTGRLQAQDMLGLYESALLKLTPRTREIFLLHRRDGFTYAQIAAKMSLSVSGVEKHMMKAIAHLDRILGRL